MFSIGTFPDITESIILELEGNKDSEGNPKIGSATGSFTNVGV